MKGPQKTKYVRVDRKAFYCKDICIFLLSI